jgi:hypothetical protein
MVRSALPTKRARPFDPIHPVLLPLAGAAKELSGARTGDSAERLASALQASVAKTRLGSGPSTG